MGRAGPSGSRGVDCGGEPSIPRLQAVGSVNLCRDVLCTGRCWRHNKRANHLAQKGVVKRLCGVQLVLLAQLAGTSTWRHLTEKVLNRHPVERAITQGGTSISSLHGNDCLSGWPAIQTAP